MSLGGASRDVGAVERAQLREVARHKGAEFQLVLAEFGIERLLYRLGVSPHVERFVLKGATLLKLWSEDRGRATWDLDLLGRGSSATGELVQVMRELCEVPNDDGIIFDADTVAGEEIRSIAEYGGVRIRLTAWLAGARIPMQIDVGFGDMVVPPPRLESYPTLLDHPPPRILAYPREAVVAEKFEAIVALGVTNSRMKDFYDLHFLSQRFSFEGGPLVRAVRTTFHRRGTPLPAEVPLALTADFLAAPERQAHWRAFLRRGRLSGPPDTQGLADGLRAFIRPLLDAAAHEEAFDQTWAAGGPWASRVLAEDAEPEPPTSLGSLPSD